MSLLSGDIDKVQKNAQTDIASVEAAETRVITAAVTSFEAMIHRLIDGYTIQIKAVKN